MAKTGYKIITYIDVNPQSPTFQTQRTERVTDSECNAEGSNWEVVSSYCEVDGNGGNTGYYITTEMDTNLESPTYGQTRNSKSYNQSQCPLPSTDPQWAVNEDKSYCETVTFPSGLDGNTGRYIVSMTDENRNSSTYNQTIESALTESEWTEEMEEEIGPFPCPSADTRPKLEVLSEACQLVVKTDGTVSTNGFKDILGIDRNPYSWTYLSAITQTVQDLVKCPSGQTTNTYVFELDDWGTSREETVESDTRQITYDLTTTKNGEYIGYTVSENCSWLSTDKGMDYITLFFENNTSSSDRECEVTLTQNESENEITINVTQKKKAETYTPYTLSDRYLIDGSLPSEEFYIYYFATDSNWSTIITDGVTLEIVESGFTFTEIDSGIDSNGRKYKKYRASENSTNKDKIARFKAVYNGVDSNITRIKQSGKDQTILPDFDYLTFIFNWDTDNGRDFDTATYVSGTPYTISGKTLYELPVGYNCDGSKEQYSAATSVYLQHGGDNTQSGDECALINWKKICNYDYISAGITTLYCDLYGNWYREFGDGNCRVTYKTYKGDGMKHGTEENKYIFVPSGNTELVTEKTISGNVRAFSSTNASSEKKENYSKIARFEYDIATKSALLTNLMVTPSGRNLRGYATIGGEVIKGLNDANVGSLKYNYNSSAQSGSISIGSFYNIINGTRYDAESLSLEIKYYKKGGDVLQEGYATATLSNGILSWTIEANTSGYDREVDFYITGTESHRNIIYRIDCVQSA